MVLWHVNVLFIYLLVEETGIGPLIAADVIWYDER